MGRRKNPHGRIDDGGYRIVPAPAGHPQARPDGSIREHRLVLHEAIGPGVHPCHWCEWPVSWEVTYRPGGSREERWEALIPDHLDGDRQNNTAENLRPACPWCNENRGGMPTAGAQPADFVGQPPWERPRFGNTPPMQGRHGRRRRAVVPLGATSVPEVPAPGVPAEVEEELAAEAERAPLPVAMVRPPRRRRGWVWAVRWLAVLVAVPVGWRWGVWWAVLVVAVWWGGSVMPPVRRRRAGPADDGDGGGRSFVSWEQVIADLHAAAPMPAARPVSAARADVDGGPVPAREVVVETLVELEDLPVLGDDPTGEDVWADLETPVQFQMDLDDDDGEPTAGATVTPLVRSGRPAGPPPPPKRRR